MEMTDEELTIIQNQIYEAYKTKRSSRWSGMSYEAGVIAALEWVLEERDEKPMSG